MSALELALAIIEMYGGWVFEESGDPDKEASRRETRVRVFRARAYAQLARKPS